MSEVKFTAKAKDYIQKKGGAITIGLVRIGGG